ncbi:hypothetical protein GCM10023194_78210 [Planotetraspora phitsanulokensis]|uniref:DUF4276 family protein n=1 Tax=Planotetraspora phitsanulokensis TaxID=575192 RepID=A0A8J3XGQ4_9ACTN|nr:DUF4276 family protein [Planotetraspora phitsanulokensis]GII41107.1 hypothetical protein Pph01_61100 [Planotetraspora phitsanulokensis]
MVARKKPLKVGIVVEGESEIAGLPKLYTQLGQRTGKQFLRPLRATADPCAPIPVLVQALRDRVRLAIAKGADMVVILLDREQQNHSASARARAIENAIAPNFSVSVRVVLKDRTFENWLISCPSAFIKQRSRFPHFERISRVVEPGRADKIDKPHRLLNDAMNNQAYDKTKDAPKILHHANIAEMARNSRSFRRFLAVTGDALYQGGSCTSREVA